VGEWLRRNGEAIYGSQRAKVGWDSFGMMTVKGKTMFLMIDKWTGTEFTIGRITGTVRNARFLATGKPVKWEQADHRIHLKGLPENPPDAPFTVIAVDFESVPMHSSGPSCERPAYAWGDPLQKTETVEQKT
jgi:hypothetical protein